MIGNDSINDRLELNFLRYLFNDKKYIADSIGKIQKVHFQKYGWVLQMLQSYYGKYKDIITDDMVDVLFAKKSIHTDEAVKYKILISDLRHASPGTEGEYRAICDELEKNRKARELISLAEYIADSDPLETDVNQIFEDVKNKVYKIEGTGSEIRKEGTIQQSARERWERYNHIKLHPEEITVVPTGFKAIDEPNGGFRPGELVYVIGRKGDGKSVFLINLGHNAWLAGKNVIFFTLEISQEDYERRFDARAAQVSSNGLKRGNLTPEEEKEYKEYLINLEKKENIVYIVDCPKGCSPAFIEAKLQALEGIYPKFDMIIIDYADIMVPNSNTGEVRHNRGQVALDLKRTARDYEAVVVSASQMSRSGAKAEQVTTEHVAESDQVSDHLDWGFGIRSVDDVRGKVESFKTRDAAPVNFSFRKMYAKMTMAEYEELAGWDNLGNDEM